MPRLIAVAVPVPALDLLTYRIPDTIALPVAGARVVVPLGRRTLTGVVVGAAPTPSGDFSLRDVVEVLDDAAFIPADVLQLTEWVGDFYLAGPGSTLAAAMPPHALTGRVDRFRTMRIVSLSAEGHDAGVDAGRGLRQKDAVAALKAAPDGLSAGQLAAAGISAAVVNRLHALGLVTVRKERVDRDPFASGAALETRGGEGARVLTDEQRTAVATLGTLAATRKFHVALVHGVTGSGKTEVYLHLAEQVRRSGRGVLMLVPEIALTPAVAAVFRARFGTGVAIQHSGLSEGERHDQWHRIRRGDVDVVIGTRSAIFAPLARPGLIIVDEEHDTSYKQEEMPRYHGRDVAVMRGKFADALVVLGSATPSMESYANAQQSRYTLISLKRRVLDRPLAAVRIINMRDEFAEEGPDVILSRPLREAMQARLDKHEQILILLNRRGYAASVFCRQCGSTMDCPNCSVSLTVHTGRNAWRARCHYCNYSRLVPRQCLNCAAPYLEHVGFGTERVEAEVAALFPHARIGRVDRDTIRKRGSLADLLNRFARRELDVLVGTQMIAKGHDFPQVTLVGVISADVGLGMADFRAAERTFQLLTQVAGRAGRGEQAGEAMIQTLFPGHYSIRFATAQDYPAFYDKEIEFRRAMRYPPLIAMINVVVKGPTYDTSMAAAADLARRVSEISKPTGGFVLLGPAPAPLTRLRGENRAQFFLKGTSRAAMRAALRQALSEVPEIARKTAVDVDPLSVL
ncbi:MAG TPA: primosomal protein N' [Vicinamibacterales bacterium]|nr:primosomal protein N' [Vicinamibacterales bacterium]